MVYSQLKAYGESVTFSVLNHLPAFGGYFYSSERFLQECVYVQSHISLLCLRGKCYVSPF